MMHREQTIQLEATHTGWQKLILALVGSVLLVGCGDDEDTAAASRLPYGADQTVVIGGTPGGSVTGTPSGDECLDGLDGCVQPQKVCGDDARADVIVDTEGKVIQTFCYPTGSNVVSVDQADGNLKDHAAGSVIILDDVADGVDVQGNVEIKADNVVIYGRGADVSVIDGNLKINGNNVRVRGVRIGGNLEIEGDGVLVALSVIEGNAHLKKTSSVVADCDVFGNLQTDQGGNSLIGNQVMGTWQVAQDTNVCSGNQAFADTNANKVVDAGEVLQTLSCPTK